MQSSFETNTATNKAPINVQPGCSLQSFYQNFNPENDQIIPVSESTYNNRHRSHKPRCTRWIQKKKSSRTIFTTKQIVAMEQIFKNKAYIFREERRILAQRIQIDEQAIETWFQNRRHMSEKMNVRVNKPDAVLPVDEAENLSYIDNLINERADQSGNVLLDDVLLTELGNVLDKYLS